MIVYFFYVKRPYCSVRTIKKGKVDQKSGLSGGYDVQYTVTEFYRV